MFEMAKYGIVGATLFPLRVILLVGCLILAWGVASLSLVGLAPTVGDGPHPPLPYWRVLLLTPLPYLARGMLLGLGYHWISVEGTPASPQAAPVVVAASHSGLAEVLYLLTVYMPSVVSFEGNKKAPLGGTILRAMQAIFVDRGAPASRGYCAAEMRRRATLERGRWPQILVFPEGMCTNSHCLVSFKNGAFRHGGPVQPVAVDLPYCHFNHCWITGGPGGGALILRTMLQFYNRMDVKFLPVHTPTGEEKADADLYAMHVREKLCAALDMSATEHSLEDAKLAHEAYNMHIPPAAGTVEFHKLHRLFDLSFAECKEHMTRFLEMDVEKTGKLTIEQVAKGLHLPVTPLVKHLFSSLDADGDGFIDFRETLFGLLTMRKANLLDSDAVLEHAFSTFDMDGDGKVSLEEFHTIMTVPAAFPSMTRAESAAVFRDAAKSKDYLFLDEFKAYGKKHPEYVELFVDAEAAT